MERAKKVVSCNLTLMSVLRKKSYSKVFSTLPTPNWHETCMNPTYFKNKTQFFYLPIFPIFFGLSQETNNLFLGQRHVEEE